MKRVLSILTLLVVLLASGSAARPAFTKESRDIEGVKDRLRSMIDSRLSEMEALCR